MSVFSAWRSLSVSNWGEFIRRPPVWSRVACEPALALRGEDGELGILQSGGRGSFGGWWGSWMPPSMHEEVKKKDPDSSQDARQEEKWQQAKIEKAGIQTGWKGKQFHCCPERLWCSCPCTFPGAGWLKPWTTWCDPRADLSSGKNLDQRPPGVPCSLSCYMIDTVEFWNTNTKIHKF